MTRGERVRRVRGQLAAWAAVWLVVAGTAVLTHMLTFTQLSPIDEFQHVDYLEKTLDLEQVNGGEKVGQVAMREQACRGADLPGFEFPRCTAAELLPEQFPGSGFNHTYADPPTYYAITAPAAKLVQTVTGVDSIVTAGRSVGVLWLAAGLMATFLLARRLGAREWAAAGATLLLASTPAVLEATATITTDAPELVVGAVLTLLAVGVVERRVSAWWLAPAAAAATAFKTTSLTVIGMLALFLLIHAVRSRRAASVAPVDAVAAPAEPGPRTYASHLRGGGRGRYFLPTVVLLVAGAVPLVVWTAYTKVSAFSTVDDIPVGQMFHVDSLGWPQIANSFKYLFTPVNASYLPPFMDTESVVLMVIVLNVLLIAGTAGLAWFGLRRDLSTSLAGSVFASMALGGPALALMLFVTEHVSYAIPGRYGLSLLPAGVACVAVAASRRAYGGPVLVALGVAGMAAFLAACA